MWCLVFRLSAIYYISFHFNSHTFSDGRPLAPFIGFALRPVRCRRALQWQHSEGNQELMSSAIYRGEHTSVTSTKPRTTCSISLYPFSRQVWKTTNSACGLALIPCPKKKPWPHWARRCPI